MLMRIFAQECLASGIAVIRTYTKLPVFAAYFGKKYEFFAISIAFSSWCPI
jgi:hypothetical protein